MTLAGRLESFTHYFAKWAGSASGFIVAVGSVIVWFVGGTIFGFSSNWVNAVAIYIGTVSFLMLFLIQRGQNKEFAVLHVKLNELLAATKNADNRVMIMEELTEREISEVKDVQREIAHKL